jgi:hypothetical protein
MKPTDKPGDLAANPVNPARPDEAWDEVSESEGLIPFFEFRRPGDLVEGKLCGMRKVRDRDRHVVEDIHGKRWIRPEHAQLLRSLALCATGDVVRIVYQGESEFESRTYGHVVAKQYIRQAASSPSPGHRGRRSHS